MPLRTGWFLSSLLHQKYLLPRKARHAIIRDDAKITWKTILTAAWQGGGNKIREFYKGWITLNNGNAQWMPKVSALNNAYFPLKQKWPSFKSVISIQYMAKHIPNPPPQPGTFHGVCEYTGYTHGSLSCCRFFHQLHWNLVRAQSSFSYFCFGGGTLKIQLWSI